MTPPRFSDDELLALIEGELPADRATAMRDAVRDGDIELAGRLIDMAEHRDFLREMRITRADLNPESARTPEGVVAAAIAAAEREALVPPADLSGQNKRAWWVGPLAACTGVAALIAVGFAVLNSGPAQPVPYELSREFVGPPAPDPGLAAASESKTPTIILLTDRERAALRERERRLDELAKELLNEPAVVDQTPWPDLAGDAGNTGIADPFEADPIDLPGGSGIANVLTDEEISSALAALEDVGVETGSDVGTLRFAGVDPIGIERNFTLEEAVALAKAGRLAIQIEESDQRGFALAGGYLADANRRYALFAAAPGAGGPAEVEQLRSTDRVTGLSGRVGEALGISPRALASYSFEAAGARNQASDVERATMLELLAAIVSPMNTGHDGSRIRLIELPFDASDEPSIGQGEAEDPFWWLQPEADFSQRGTALIPVLVK
jgi:hypothetical protein